MKIWVYGVEPLSTNIYGGQMKWFSRVEGMIRSI